jgi:hypothetical protein
MTAEDNKTSSSNHNLQIKPEDLKKKIDKGEDIFILDVRNPEEHKSWKVSYDKYQDSSVIPIDVLMLSSRFQRTKKLLRFVGTELGLWVLLKSSLGWVIM